MSRLSSHNPTSGVLGELSDPEHARILKAVLAHVDAHPLIKTTESVPFLMRSPFALNRVMRVTSFVLAILLVSGSATYAAETALPGDFLYPIKIHVNERVVGALKSDGLAKAEWESEKAERRFQEAELLATMGRLNPKAREEIQQSIEENLHAFSVFTALLPEKNASTTEKTRRAHVRLEAKIDAHSKILERLQDYTTHTQQVEVKHLELGVRKKAAEIQEAKPKLAEKEPEKKLESKKEALVDRMQKTREAIEAEKQVARVGLEQHILEDGSQSLEIARRALIYAEIEKTEGKPEKAYSSLVDSEKATEEALTQLNQIQLFGGKKADLK